MAFFFQVIIDGGATKTEFAVLKDKEPVHQFFAAGINANYASDEQIENVFIHFVESLPPNLKDQIGKVTYYGAGCANEQNSLRIATVILRHFPATAFQVYSDLMGACHALCGNDKGLIAIMGTGSSSALYNGTTIEKRAPSLGYMIGDEGSGTHLGKKLIKAYLMEQLPNHLLDALDTDFNLDFQKVITRIYRKSYANKFFASFAPFILANSNEPAINALCKESFSDFFDTQIAYYKNKDTIIHLMGSVAYNFTSIIKEVAVQKGYTIGTVIGSPMPNLIKYYAS